MSARVKVRDRIPSEVLIICVFCREFTKLSKKTREQNEKSRGFQDETKEKKLFVFLIKQKLMIDWYISTLR